MRRESLTDPETLLRIALAVALGFVALRAALLPENPLDMLAISDNDDIMRMLSVRDLLAGQGWFDTVQYRILPPEGLPMHWSRYVDAAIAGLIGAAASFVPMAEAEAFALVAWPSLLLAALILLTGRGARSALSAGAAALAVVAIMAWPVTAYTYFRPARLDHHNLQILLMTAMVLTLVRPGPPMRLGVAGGLLAALSLAVGLETVPLIGLAGIVLAARALRSPDADGTHLLGFALTLAPASLALFAGQTAPHAWLVSHCDQLSPPTLSLALVAAAASTSLVVLARGVSRAAGVLGFAAFLGAGLALAAPVLRPCLAGPYAVLPPEVMQLLPTIREVRPAHWFLVNGPAVFFANVAPAIGAVLTASGVLLFRRLADRAGPGEARVVGTLLVLAAVPLAGSFVQVRLIVLTAPAVPMLAGYALAALLAEWRRHGVAAAGLALGVVVTATLLPPALYDAARALRPAPVPAWTGTSVPYGSCRKPGPIRTLAVLPEGTILSPINLGAPILLLTGHSAVSGPYHRRPEAIANGIVPFDADRSGLLEAMDASGADYLLLCRGVAYGDGRSFAADLATGMPTPGLVPVNGPDPALVVLRRDRSDG